MHKKKFNFSAFSLLNITLLIIFGIITLLPILHVASKAISGQGPVVSGDITFYPQDFQLDTVLYVLQQPEFLNAFWVSLRVTGFGTIFAMIITVMTAYPLSKPKLKGRKVFLYFFVVVMLFRAGMVPNYLLFRSLGLINTIYSLIFAAMFSVFNMFIVKNYFESLPESVEEAARIDGANNITTLFKIVLPMSAPVLATVTLFYSVTYWNDYFAGVMYITDPKLKSLQQYLYDLIRSSMNVFDASGTVVNIDDAMNLSGETVRAATIVVSTLPILVVYPMLQKHFVKGVTIGSVKG